MKNLTYEEEKKLLRNSKLGCNKSTTELFKHFQRFKEKTLKELNVPSKNTDYAQWSEADGCANKAFLIAIKKFKIKLKYRFSSYLRAVIRNRVISEVFEDKLIKTPKRNKISAELRLINAKCSPQDKEKEVEKLYKKHGKENVIAIQDTDKICYLEDHQDKKGKVYNGIGYDIKSNFCFEIT